MKKIALEQIEPLIAEHDGNVAAIARALHVSRGTIWNRINESKQLQAALHEAREAMIDEVESKLYSKAKEGDVASMIFFLKTQGKRRGYIERQELSGPEGTPLAVVIDR